MRERARVGARGQAVIPKSIRDKLGIRAGDDIVFTTHGDHAHVTPLRQEDPWADTFARLHRIETAGPLDVDRIVDEEMEKAGHGDLR